MEVNEVADMFDISEANVRKHFQEHGSEESDVPSNHGEMLDDLLRKLYRRVQGLLKRPVSDGSHERDIASHVKSVRELIKDIKQLKGELETSSTIKIEQSDINFQKWNAFLLGNLCSDCKEKYAEWLEKQEHER